MGDLDNAWKILAWVQASIAERGGTGRRLWRVQDGTGLTDQVLADALIAGEEAGLFTIDAESGRAFGFVYVVPTDRRPDGE